MRPLSTSRPSATTSAAVCSCRPLDGSRVIASSCLATWTAFASSNGRRNLGFTLEEIAELLDLRIESVESCEQVKDRTQTKLGEIDGKMRQLRRMRKALSDLVDACDERSTTDSCPILSGFTGE